MDRSQRTLRTLIAGFGILVASLESACADVIDGTWCHADGRRLSIRGPQIKTPAGTDMRGDYTRHSFVYVVPAGEPGTGETVSMILLSEYLMHARQGGNDAPVQVWNRCPPDISELNTSPPARPMKAMRAA
jgi:hypothetical protein